MEIGEKRKSEATAKRMYAKGYAIEDIADVLDETVEQIEAWVEDTPA